MPEDKIATEMPFRPGLAAVFDIVRRLRAPDGCPWDREQTHESLRQYLLEETYEVLEAIDLNDDGKLKEELGDLLLQVAMHAQIAEQDGRFDAAAVSEQVALKMVSRHPHVFGDTSVHDAEDVLRNWEAQKMTEAAAAGRASESPLDRVPRALPALAWTLGLQKRAARVGFDIADSAASARAVAGEAAQVAASLAGGEADGAFDEIGDLLFAIVSLSRKVKVNPEDALRVAGRRFVERYKALEQELAAGGRTFRDLSSAEIEAAWEATRAT